MIRFYASNVSNGNWEWEKYHLHWPWSLRILWKRKETESIKTTTTWLFTLSALSFKLLINSRNIPTPKSRYFNARTTEILLSDGFFAASFSIYYYYSLFQFIHWYLLGLKCSNCWMHCGKETDLSLLVEPLLVSLFPSLPITHSLPTHSPPHSRPPSPHQLTVNPKTIMNEDLESSLESISVYYGTWATFRETENR